MDTMKRMYAPHLLLGISTKMGEFQAIRIRIVTSSGTVIDGTCKY